MPAEIPRVVAASTPDQIHLSWTEDPTTTVTIVWHTDSSSNPNEVQYGTDASYGQTATGTSYPSTGSGSLHEATLRGLLSNTRYHYRVSGDTGSWSADRSFVTAPVGDQFDFRFLAAADMGRTSFSVEIANAMAARSASFTVGAGDYWYSDSDSSIDDWFNINQDHMSQAPFMPAVGNHEVCLPDACHDPAQYFTRFSLPPPESYYSFYYGGAFFLIIDTTGDYSLGSPQRNFIDSELLKASVNSSVKWTFAVLHYPPFASSWGFSELRNELSPVFDNWGVDVVITGHAHLYERTFPVRADGTVMQSHPSRYNDSRAPLYTVTGGGGASPFPGSSISSTQCPSDPEPWSARCLEVFEFLEFNVTSTRVVMSAIAGNGTIVDGFTLATSEPPNQAPSLSPIGNKNIDERNRLSFTATAQDPEGDFLTFFLGPGAPAGASITSTGSFTWTPTEAQGPGDYPVVVHVSDGDKTDSETITIRANEVNEAPVLAAIGNKVVNEETPLSFTATATDADLPAQSLAFSLDAGTPAGTSITAAGVFSWMPTEAQGPNSYTITIRVTDSFGGFDSEPITVTVNEVNRPPVLNPVGSKSSGEKTALSFTATASDPDIPAQTLTFTLGPAPTGTFPTGATVTADGVFDWTPTEAQGPGEYYARITVSDSLETDFEDILITVIEVNKPPILSVPGPRTVNEGSDLLFIVSATDPDIPANTVTLACTNCAAIGASFDAATGQFFWTPGEAHGPGGYTVSFTATDNGVPSLSETRPVSITVNEVNELPTLEPIPDKEVDEETTLTLTTSASDPDLPPQPLTFTLSGTASGATIDSATGVFTWPPAENQGPGTYAATITVTDSYGGSASRTFTITVLEVPMPPVLIVPSGQVVDEEFSLNFAITATDPDVPSNTVTLSVSNLPEGSVFDPATGTFSWTPTELQGPGEYTVFFTATDDGDPSLLDTEPVTITVKEVNKPPILNPVGNRTGNEQTFLRFNATASDTDIPSQTLTFSLGPGQPPGATITPEGAFAWSPSEMRGPGTVQVTIIVSDGSLVDSETITITINEVNKPPVLEVPGTQTVDEGVVLTFVINWTDPDLPANLVVLSCENCAALGATFDPGTGTFSWTPSEAQGPQVYKVNFTATDNGSPVMFDLEQVTIAVGEVGSPPSLDPIELKTGDEESLVSFTVTASDSDLPAQTLTFSMSPNAPAGATINPSTGVFTWVPSESQGPGTFSFTITVSDGLLPDSKQVTIEVYEVNEAPVLAAVGPLGIDEEKEFRFTFLATDRDIPAQLLSFSQEEASGLFPIGAAMSPEGLFTWTPSELQGPGVYTIRIIVRDGIALDSEEVIINVAEVNKRPVLEPINNQVSDEEASLTFTAVASDPDSPANTLFFALGPDKPVGASIDPVTGVFRWTPSESQGPGVYTISVFAIDSGSPSMSDLWIVPVTVNEVNKPPVLAAVGEKAVQEEQTLSFTLSASDPDDPAQQLSFASLSLPAGSTFEASTGFFSWTPSEDQGPGSYVATFQVSDGIDASEELTVNITVNEFNLPPSIVVAPTHTVSEKSLLTFTVRVVDLDAPENLLQLSATNLPTGASFDPSTGLFSWTPDEAHGPDTYSVTFTVIDNGFPPASNTTTVTIDVLEVNGPPVGTPIDNQTIDEETARTFTVTALDPDIPVQVLFFSLGAGSPDGVSIDPSTGMFYWMPSEAQGPGVYSINITVSDGSLASSQTFSITVRDVNEVPILNTVGDKTVDEQTILTFTATASDTDLPSQTLTFSLGPGQPLGASITLGGVFSWSPSETRGPGTAEVTIIVSDGSLVASENITISINEVNKAPVLNSIGDKSSAEETQLTFAVTATDVDFPANILSFSLGSGTPAGATIDLATGVFTWTPSEAQGPGVYSITVIATDNGFPALSHSETITITVNEVNRPPQMILPGSQTVQEGNRLAFIVIPTDPDLPTNTLTLSATGVPGNAIFDPPTGTFVWTPQETQGPGDYTVTFLLSDGSLTHLDSVSISVLETNRTPTLTVPDPQTVDEGILLTFTVSASDPDVPANAVTLSATSLPTGALFDPSTGRLTWTPDETQGLTDYTISFTATDNGNPPLSVTKIVTIAVREVNASPQINPVGGKTVNEMTPLSFSATASDPDLPAQTLTFSLGGGAPSGASMTGDGALTWIPSEAQGPGTYFVTIIVSDGSLTDSETVTVTVFEVNRPPEIVVPGAQTVNEGTSLTFTITATDPDTPSQQLALSAVSVPLGANFNPDTGEFSWIPTETQGPGTYAATFQASDGSAADVESVSITVREVNQFPILAPIGPKNLDEETNLTFNATASDPDQPLQTLTFTIGTGAPTGATIDPTRGTFSWTPSEDRGPGDYLVTIIVSDGAATDSETITISVAETNKAPMLGSIGGKTVDEGILLTFTLSASDADLPTQAYSFSAESLPFGASLNPTTGRFSWTPSESQGPGTFTVTFVVSDGSLTDSETVAVTVNEINRPPTLSVASSHTVIEETQIIITVGASDPDIPANTLTSSVSGMPQGASFDPATGTFSWTPSEAQGPGSYAITFTVIDSGLQPLSDTETVTIIVSEANSAPVLDLIGDKAGNEQTTITFQSTASDQDIPAQTLTFSLEPGAPTGATINTSTGVFSWIPSESRGPGTYPVTIIVSDGLLSDSETITISVNETNQPPTLASIGAKTVNELTLLSFVAVASDLDIPAQALTFELASAPAGGFPEGASMTSAGVFSWTPSEAQGPGSYQVTIVVSDGFLADSETIIIVVNEVCCLPPVLDPVLDKTVDERTLLTFSATASDGDIPAQTLTFSLGPGSPGGATIDSLTGVFTWTPTETQGPGSYTISIIVSDGTLTDTETFVVNVNETNRPPSINGVGAGSQIVDEETFLLLTITTSDPDTPENLVVLSASDLPAGATFDPLTHRFTWTPSEAQGPGTYTVIFTATDDGTPSLSTTKTVTIVVNEVNTAPRIILPGDQTVSEGSLLTFSVTTLDSDLPTNIITLSASDVPEGAAFNSQTGAFTWTPSESQGPGIFTIRFTATDNGIPSISSSTSLKITVQETNTAPTLQDIGDKTVNEQTLLTFTVRALDVDIPTQSMLFSLDPGITAAAITADGVFSWNPSEARGPGVYQIVIAVSDGLVTDSETIFVTVNEVNIPPELDPIGSRSIVEGNTLAIVASALDRDIPSQNLVYLLGSNAPEGASITLQGVFSWTPSEAQGPGSFQITVIVSDGSLNDSETILVTVNEAGTFPPVLNPIGDKIVDEGTLLRFNATASDADIPPQTLTYSASSLPPGANIDPATGTFTWTPTESHGPNTYSVTIIVSDGSMTDSEVITITVNEVNRSPSISVPGSQTVEEGIVLSFVVTATDPDSPANSITFSASNMPQGATFDPVTRRFTWTPTEEQGPGSYLVTFTATDDGVPSLSASKSVAITVNETNQEPVLTNIGDKIADEEALLTFTVSSIDSDIPRNSLAYSLGSGAPAGSTIDPVTGVFTWTPSESQGPSLYSVTIIVTDNGSPARFDSETIAITVREANRPPTLIPIGDKTGNEQTLLTFTATATDADIPANTLTFTLGPGAPSGATITSTGVFTWTPTEAQGPAVIAITIIVSDGSLTSSETFSITVNEVNRPPSLTVPSSQTIDEGALVTFAITSTDPDIPVNTLTLSASSLPTGATFDAATGTFSWTPSETQGPGSYSVRFTVADNGMPALNSTKTVAITINEVNTPPRLILPGEQTVNEENLLAFAVTASDPDIPMQTLILSSISLPAGASFNPATGIFSWTPAENVEPGTYPATLRVSDGSLTDTQTVMIRVVEVNQPPVLSPVGNKATDEERLLRFNVTASDPDIPAQTLTFSLGGGTPTGALITSRGTFSWTPTEIQGPAIYQVTIIVTDGNATDSETITITVAEVNRPPVVNIPAQQTIREGQLLIFSVSATDPDVPTNSVILSTSSLPAGASFDAATGVFSWTPSELQGPATVIVSFTVTDNGTPTLSNTKSLAIQVDEVNEAPVLSPIGNQAVNERERLRFVTAAADSDLPLQALRFSLVFDGESIGASIDAVTGEFTWIPSEARGPGSFQVTIAVTDGVLTDSETIIITVNEVNTAPVLDTIGPKTVDEGIQLTFTVGALDSDIPVQTLTFSLGPDAPVGASMTPAGVFSWIPTEDQGPSTVQVTIIVSDGSATDSETITITVSELPNSVPVLAPIGHKTVDEGTELVFIVSATDADIPAQALTVSALDLPLGATFDASTHRFSWAPLEIQGPGTYTLTIIVTDDGSPRLSDSETITVTVREVNSSPFLALIGDRAVNEQTSMTFQATASDADLPSQPLFFLLVSDTGLGASITPNGVFSWTPSEARGPGTYQLTIIVSDGSLTDSETITITVNEVNRQPSLTVPDPLTANEGVSLIFSITIVDPDLDSSGRALNNITINPTGLPQGSTFDTTTGLFSWTPQEIHGPGTYTIVFTAVDNGSPSFSDTKTVIITVNEVNSPPKLDPIGDKTVNEQTRLSFTVLASDPDNTPQRLTFSLAANAPQGAVIDSVTGEFSWIPSEARGPDVVQVTIVLRDSDGFTDSQTISITVVEANSPPILNKIGPRTVTVGEALSFTVNATDGDAPVQSLTFSLRQAPTGTFPQGATITADGVFSWTPEGQASGTYRVRIVVSDGTAETFDDITLTLTGGEGALSLAFQPDLIPWFSLGLGVPVALAIVFRSLGKNHKRPVQVEQ